MKARIYINRHIVKSNKKTGRDDACIAIRTYKGVKYAKKVELFGSWTLKQDFEKPYCSGATIWLEGYEENYIAEDANDIRSDEDIYV